MGFLDRFNKTVDGGNSWQLLYQNKKVNRVSGLAFCRYGEVS
jgi:hypothetical protein